MGTNSDPLPPETNSLKIPEKIGEYKIEKILRRGGMGIVYFATHPTTHERVVVKVLLPKYLKDVEMLSRLVREARVMGIADHPNIVKLFDLGQWEEGLFIAMEYVAGVSLRQFIREKALTSKKVLEIVLQIAYGLSHLHGHGIVHRDLKPENVLMTESGNIKLIDFGISLFLNPEFQEETKMDIHVRMGTPEYMSPEQMANPENVSFSSDIYSLGVITYELLVGRSSAVIYLSLLPKALRKILEKALQFDPSKRYQDIVDFIADITAYLKNIDAENGEESSDLFFELLKESRNFLIADALPSMANIEMGMANRGGTSYHTPYVDLFSFSRAKLGIFFAEPHDVGIHSLTRASMLKGMMRTAILQTQDPREILLIVKKALFSERIQHLYNAAFLVLDQEKGTYTFISCNLGSLWNYPDREGVERIFNSENPPIGPDLEPLNILEERLETGNTLIFSSIRLNPQRLSFRNELILAPVPLAKKAIDKVYPYDVPGVIVVIRVL